MAVYKVVIKNLDGTSSVVMTTEYTTATPQDVSIGRTFYQQNGVLANGEAYVAKPVSEYEINYSGYDKPEKFRYRVIPTKQEYIKGQGAIGVGVKPDYEQILPVQYVNPEGSQAVLATTHPQLMANKYDEISVYAGTPVYDNYLKGFVVKSFGSFSDGETMEEMLMNEIVNRFGNFVYSRAFSDERVSFNETTKRLNYYLRSINGTECTLANGVYVWFTDLNLVEELKQSVLSYVKTQAKILLPELFYELSKFTSKGNLFNSKATSYEDVVTKLALIRKGNHIENSTRMKTANTPEVIEELTQEQAMERYASSLFTSSNEKEDYYTNVWKTFNDSWERLVTEIAYRCFIPNDR